MTSAWKRYKEKNGVTPLDLLNPRYHKASEELSEARFNVCKKCPELIPIIDQCKKCGCFIKVKKTMKLAQCPLGKWPTDLYLG